MEPYLVVSDAQVEAARLLMELEEQEGAEAEEAIRAIANAQPIHPAVAAVNGSKPSAAEALSAVELDAGEDTRAE